MLSEIFSFIIMSFLFFSSCNFEENHERDFQNKLESLIVNSNSDTLSLKIDEMVNFEWDYFIVIPPYTIVDLLEDEININFESLKKTRIQYRDDVNVLCFISGNKLIECFIQPFYPIDFSEIGDLTLYSKETADFILLQQGEKFIVNITK